MTEENLNKFKELHAALDDKYHAYLDEIIALRIKSEMKHELALRLGMVIKGVELKENDSED